jgi:hypothetical protein
MYSYQQYWTEWGRHKRHILPDGFGLYRVYFSYSGHSVTTASLHVCYRGFLISYYWTVKELPDLQPESSSPCSWKLPERYILIRITHRNYSRGNEFDSRSWDRMNWLKIFKFIQSLRASYPKVVLPSISFNIVNRTSIWRCKNYAGMKTSCINQGHRQIYCVDEIRCQLLR